MKKSILILFLALSCLSAQPGNLPIPGVFSSLNAADGLSDNQVQHILQLPDGRMVFTTWGNINLYDGFKFKYIHRKEEDVYPLADYVGAYHVYVGKNDLLWVKDWKRVWCLDLRKEEYVHRPDSIFKTMGMHEHVTDLFVDSEKQLWLVTSDGLWINGHKRFCTLPADAGKLQDLETDDGRLYLFFSHGEVFCHELQSHKLLYRKAAYPQEEIPRFGHQSLVIKGPHETIYQIRTGREAGVFAFNTESQSWRTLMVKPNFLHTLIIPTDSTALISSSHGIWQVNLHSGHNILHTTLHTDRNDTLRTDINSIFQDKHGGIWLGSRILGLFYTHPKRYKMLSIPTLHNISMTDSDRKPLRFTGHTETYKGKIYNDVHIDSKGRAWAGTPDGLRLFLPGNEHYTSIYTEDGLTNNFIHAITEDRNHRIWISTSHGISRLENTRKPDSFHITSFQYEDGTLRDEYYNKNVRELSDGRLIFGGVGGFTVFHPDSVNDTGQHFKPLLVECLLHGNPLPIAPDGNTGKMQASAPYVQNLTFNHKQNHLSFVFSALNYSTPTHNAYRYRLTHSDDSTWHVVQRHSEGGGNIDAKGNLHLSFALLPPGQYRLQVMASTQTDKWEGDITELSFEILAPWWRTTWAYLLYLIVITAFAGLIIYLYIRETKQRIRRKHKEEILLLRIRNLIERCDYYERKKEEKVESPTTSEEKTDTAPSLSDSLFISKAMALVEANLTTPGYSVEQLSKDLCMERTGLYKKLTALLDKSPSLFIRSIRLQRAAELIRQGEMSITEIADCVGFSSTGYMSKCFQEEYGCKPSEYATKVKKST